MTYGLTSCSGNRAIWCTILILDIHFPRLAIGRRSPGDRRNHCRHRQPARPHRTDPRPDAGHPQPAWLSIPGAGGARSVDGDRPMTRGGIASGKFHPAKGMPDGAVYPAVRTADAQTGVYTLPCIRTLVGLMKTARVFRPGNSQAGRLPKEFRSSASAC